MFVVRRKIDSKFYRNRSFLKRKLYTNENYEDDNWTYDLNKVKPFASKQGCKIAINSRKFEELYEILPIKISLLNKE